jgi:hypothetical protein
MECLNLVRVAYRHGTMEHIDEEQGSQADER